MSDQDDDNLFGNVIFSYTRKQAIEDGVLVDVTATAKEAGFKFNTVVTHRLWHDYLVPDAKDAAEGQDTQGRLWDLLTMFRLAGQKAGGKSVVNFEFIVRKNRRNETVKVYAVCGPGDTAEPVLTILCEGED